MISNSEKNDFGAAQMMTSIQDENVTAGALKARFPAYPSASRLCRSFLPFLVATFPVLIRLADLQDGLNALLTVLNHLL
jgi:hypothetical protein